MSLKANPRDLRDTGQVGDWCFLVDEKTGDDVIYLIYPLPQSRLEATAPSWRDILYDGGKGDVFSGHLSSPGKTAKQELNWDWDGNREAPTLSPSILIEDDQGERWHGYLRAGQLVNA